MKFKYCYPYMLMIDIGIYLIWSKATHMMHFKNLLSDQKKDYKDK